jgi:hypothetical protein
VHKRIVSAVRRLQSVSDRTLYIILRGQYHIIVVNIHATTEDKTDDVKSFYGELECVSNSSGA